MQDKELYQHILGLTSPWTVRERSLGGTLATSTATNAMRQMGSQYQPDAPVLKLRYFEPHRAGIHVLAGFFVLVLVIE